MYLHLTCAEFLVPKIKMGVPKDAHSCESLAVLEANERLKLVDTWLVFLRRHLSKGRVRPVRDDRVVRPASAQHRMIHRVDQIEANLQRQRLVQLRQREVALHRRVQLVQEVAAERAEADRELTELILRSIQPRLLARRGRAAGCCREE